MQKGIHNERESLEKLMQEAQLFATRCLKNKGFCAPTLCMDGLAGLKMFHPTGRSNEEMLEEISEVAKPLCVVNEAEATVLVFQGRLRTPGAGGRSGEEVVILFAGNRQQNCEKVLPIVRSRDGKFLGFGEARTVDRTGVKGFPQFIDREAPSEELKREAREILAEFGLAQTSTKEEIRRDSDAGWDIKVSAQALKDMMSYTEEIALSWLQLKGFCPQSLIMWGVEGNFAIERPAPFTQGYKWFDDRGKLACQAAGAYGCVLACEAWIDKSVQGYQPDLTQPLSEAPNKEEVLLLHGESREGTVAKVVSIVRSQDGRFIRLGGPVSATVDIRENVEFLPKEMPSKEIRTAAKRELETMGMKLKDFRIDDSWECTRCRSDDEEREEKKERGRGISR